MGGLLFFVFGLMFGSFLNVLIYRLPRELAFAREFSMCPACSHRLYPRDLVPLFSWLLLRRRCRYCAAPISMRYPAIELGNALLWLAVWLRCSGALLPSIAFSIAVSCLLVVLFVDWEHQIIPDSMHFGILLAGILLAASGLSGLSLIERVIGFFCISIPFFGIVFFSGGRAMGAGDIKLMAAIGFCFGWEITLFITILGALSGTLVVLLSTAFKKPMGRLVPFGSFLAAAAIVAIFCGDEIVHWYIALSGLSDHVH